MGICSGPAATKHVLVLAAETEQAAKHEAGNTLVMTTG